MTGRLDAGVTDACPAAGKLPHIVMVFDESSFDATMMPGTVVPPNYQERFRSFDGKTRSFVVEGAGGPSWFTEYNVLTGLSVRSYGRFAESVTRIATGRVQRGLPFALRKCGYKTYSLYSWFGAFVGARSFQTSAGIENFLDASQLRSGNADIDTDAFFYGKAAEVIARERSKGPLFLFVYLAANHFPWDFRYRPDLAFGWKNLGNPPEIEGVSASPADERARPCPVQGKARARVSPASNFCWCASAITSRCLPSNIWSRASMK